MNVTLPEVTLTLSLITGVVGFIVSWLFTYFPKLNAWFAAHTEGYKQIFMMVLGLVVCAIVFGLGCANLILTNIPCTTIGVVNVAFMWVSWVVGNQSANRIAYQPKAVKLAKLRFKSGPVETPSSAKNP